MKCRICDYEYYRQEAADPGEHCLCGQDYPYNPWQERDWPAARKQIIFRLNRFFGVISDWFYEKALK